MNGMRNSPWDLVFSSVGRTSRVAFLVSAAVVTGFVALYLEFVPRGFARSVSLWVATPVFLHMATSVLSQRLHDRGRSGWWAALFLGALAWVAVFHSAIVRAPAVLILITGVVDLGLLPGRPEANAFGPNPAIVRRSRRVRTAAADQTVR